MAARFKRDLKTESIQKKLDDGDQYAVAIAANIVTIGDVQDELDDYNASRAALKTKFNTATQLRIQSNQATTEQGDAEVENDTNYEALLSAIETKTKQDKAKMELSGIPTFEAGRSPALGQPAQVQNLVVTAGDEPGELDPSWDGNNPKPRFYKLRMGADPYDQATMVEIATPTASRFTKGGLVSGQLYWFEVCAVGSGNQQGPWSDPAKARAP